LKLYYNYTIVVIEGDSDIKLLICSDVGIIWQ